MLRNYNFKEISIEQIITNPYQPRQIFNDDMIQDLSESIKIYGIVQPLVVRKLNNKKYELIAGERRLRAAKKAGLKKVPVIINQFSDKVSAVIALVENIQREDLNFIEEAEAYKKLIDTYKFTQKDIAERVGKNQSTIANKLRLLQLNKEIRTKIIKYKLTERHARALLLIKDVDKKLEIIDKIVENELTVKKTEELIKKINLNTIHKKKKKPNIKKSLKDIRIINNTISQAVNMLKTTGYNVEYQMDELEDGYHVKISIPLK